MAERDPRIDPQAGDILRKNGRMVLIDAAFDDSVYAYQLNDAFNFSPALNLHKIQRRDVPLLLDGAEVVRVGWPEANNEVEM